jgi:hypothetical protein
MRRSSFRLTTNKGETVSTIGEEKAFNPRLQVESVDEYVELMNNLNLPNPEMMDVAVPANNKIGLSQGEVARKGWAITTADFAKAIGSHDTMIVDIPETVERDKEGVIPDSLHLPYTELKTVKTARGGAAAYQQLVGVQGKYAPLALTPGKTGRLPASDGGPASFVVERPLSDGAL